MTIKYANCNSDISYAQERSEPDGRNILAFTSSPSTLFLPLLAGRTKDIRNSGVILKANYAARSKGHVKTMKTHFFAQRGYNF